MPSTRSKFKTKVETYLIQERQRHKTQDPIFANAIAFVWTLPKKEDFECVKHFQTHSSLLSFVIVVKGYKLTFLSLSYSPSYSLSNFSFNEHGE